MKIIYLLLFFLSLKSVSQSKLKIHNKEYFKNHFNSKADKNVIILGESHASAVAAEIFPALVAYLNKKNGLTQILLEFGPAEAYFYNKYLKTGNEKHLNYTIYGGSYQQWLEAWREIYQYNNTLTNKITIIGIDFDRARTMAYALFSIFYKYNYPPKFIASLIEEIKTDEFYKTYTVGYPTKKDLKWMLSVKILLQLKIDELRKFLIPEDLELVNRIIENRAKGYNAEREKGLADNVQRTIKSNKNKNFIILIGRNHAYYNPIIDENEQMLAERLEKLSSFNLMTGAIVFEQSALRVPYYKKTIEKTLFEIRDKYPWSDYYHIINKKARHELTLIPFKERLKKLKSYLDYVIVARNQSAIAIRK